MEERIREAIWRSRLPQRVVAEALGIRQSGVSARVNGHTRWTLREAAILARLLGKSLDDLVGDEDPAIGYTLTEKAAS